MQRHGSHGKPGPFWEVEVNQHWRRANYKLGEIYYMADEQSSVFQLVLNRKVLSVPKTTTKGGF